MRVALVSTSMGYGGATTYQSHLRRQLEALGDETTRWKLADSADGRGIYAVRVDENEKEKEERGHAEVRSWNELWTDHDVVHITNPGLIYSGYQTLLDKKVGPLVLTLHDSHEVDMNTLNETLPQLVDALVDRVVFIGEHFMFYCLRNKLFENLTAKARFVPQPYQMLPRGVTEAAGLQLAVASGGIISVHPSPRVICTSAWRWNKHIETIAEAALYLQKKLPDIGPLEFWTGHQMDDVVRKVPRNGHWEHRGAWSWPGDAGTVYGTAGALVDLVYFDENDGGRTEYPILEAWEFGVVPVVRRDYAMPQGKQYELVDGENCIMVEPEPEAVADGIVKAFRETTRGRANGGRPLAQNIKGGGHTTAGLHMHSVYEEAVGV